jgi:hypothetical protein
LSIVYILIKLLCFGSWIFFRLQIKGGRTETLAVGPLVDLASDDGQCQKNAITDYNAPSSEPFRLHLPVPVSVSRGIVLSECLKNKKENGQRDG